MKYILRILIHSLFWLVFVLFYLVLYVVPKGDLSVALQELTIQFYINFVWAAVIFYLSYYWLIRYFEKSQLVRYLILSVLISVSVSVVFLIISKLITPGINLQNYILLLPSMVGTFIIAQCGCLVRGFENWFANIQLKSEIENKNLKNELKLLRLQINPHFLFNTLNNIDSLISKSPKTASKMLITLSEMLRYMVYETKTETVPLQKEIDYLASYIQLQQLRFKNVDYIRYSFPEPDVCNTQVAPMLFIPFVENAFKHSCYAEPMPVVDIKIALSDNVLSFTCVNYFDTEKISPKTAQSGIGLENVKRRLALLYSKNHELQIIKELNTFRAELTIKL